ncbi:MAG TPA: hypothetical protein VH439_16025 [Gemmatimonadales bacterium]|jgi:hypothetical protein
MRVLALLLVGAGLPAALAGQQRWERQVSERVQRAIDAVGTTASGAVVTRSGMLNIEESAAFQTTLGQGKPYTIVAVCDDDCTHLELTLLTPSGSEIAKESNSESLPTLHFTPSTTMSYGVRVRMEGCRWNPCWYAVAVIPVGKNPS